MFCAANFRPRTEPQTSVDLITDIVQLVQGSSLSLVQQLAAIRAALIAYKADAAMSSETRNYQINENR